MMVVERVRKLVAESFQVDLSTVTTETRLEDYVDSLGVVELIMALEEEFGLEIADEQAEAITSQVPAFTVGQLAAFVEEQLRRQNEE